MCVCEKKCGNIANKTFSYKFSLHIHEKLLNRLIVDPSSNEKKNEKKMMFFFVMQWFILPFIINIVIDINFSTFFKHFIQLVDGAYQLAYIFHFWNAILRILNCLSVAVKFDSHTMYMPNNKKKQI